MRSTQLVDYASCKVREYQFLANYENRQQSVLASTLLKAFVQGGRVTRLDVCAYATITEQSSSLPLAISSLFTSLHFLPNEY